jgi:hypothetical protein
MYAFYSVYAFFRSFFEAFSFLMTTFFALIEILVGSCPFFLAIAVGARFLDPEIAYLTMSLASFDFGLLSS